ncbi:sugar phosphate nucleotidyltransferase [Brevibacillus sp. GCM10020057]|uniref:sugar phosphate nucleotidyltransferase n=1 Tax=Brevibacillus sp. GCM10020057 TaxID=3317327 RepID=UPI003628DB41
MKLVLLSGGSGKRLWPLSNDVRSKQFLKMLRNQHGEWESMVQRIWGQLQTYGQFDEVYLSTSKAQVDLIQSQLGMDVPVIIEPESKDTFGAIALAAAYLHTACGVSNQEVIAVMPVDPYVDSPFFQHILQLEGALADSGAQLALIGVEPTYPSTKYGYIVRDEEETCPGDGRGYQNVRSFKEKPTESEARKLCEQQALWNCGVFAFQLGFLLGEMEKRGIPTDYELLLNRYESLTKISFDLEIVEKSQKTVVIPYKGYWRDLGTWNTLTEEMNARIVGRGYMDEECTNTHVINELGLPVVTIGIPNAVVAVSHDGILVANKAKSHLVKEVVKEYEHRPMYEERRWGWYQVMNFQKMDNSTETLTKKLFIHAGKNLSYQYHLQRSEVWVVVAGEGDFVLDGRLQHIQPGDVLQIPQGAKHGIKAVSDMEIIEVQMGAKLVEEDIVRLGMTWDEISKWTQHG